MFYSYNTEQCELPQLFFDLRESTSLCNCLWLEHSTYLGLLQVALFEVQGSHVVEDLGRDVSPHLVRQNQRGFVIRLESSLCACVCVCVCVCVCDCDAVFP